jgi:hypothetical protein
MPYEYLACEHRVKCKSSHASHVATESNESLSVISEDSVDEHGYVDDESVRFDRRARSCRD